MRARFGTVFIVSDFNPADTILREPHELVKETADFAADWIAELSDELAGTFQNLVSKGARNESCFIYSFGRCSLKLGKERLRRYLTARVGAELYAGLLADEDEAEAEEWVQEILNRLDIVEGGEETRISRRMQSYDRGVISDRIVTRFAADIAGARELDAVFSIFEILRREELPEYMQTMRGNLREFLDEKTDRLLRERDQLIEAQKGFMARFSRLELYLSEMGKLAGADVTNSSRQLDVRAKMIEERRDARSRRRGFVGRISSVVQRDRIKDETVGLMKEYIRLYYDHESRKAALQAIEKLGDLIHDEVKRLKTFRETVTALRERFSSDMRAAMEVGLRFDAPVGKILAADHLDDFQGVDTAQAMDRMKQSLLSSLEKAEPDVEGLYSVTCDRIGEIVDKKIGKLDAVNEFLRRSDNSAASIRIAESESQPLLVFNQRELMKIDDPRPRGILKVAGGMGSEISRMVNDGKGSEEAWNSVDGDSDEIDFIQIVGPVSARALQFYPRLERSYREVLREMNEDVIADHPLAHLLPGIEPPDRTEAEKYAAMGIACGLIKLEDTSYVFDDRGFAGLDELLATLRIRDYIRIAGEFAAWVGDTGVKQAKEYIQSNPSGLQGEDALIDDLDRLLGWGLR